MGDRTNAQASRAKYGWTSKEDRYHLDPEYREKIKKGAIQRYLNSRKDANFRSSYFFKKSGGVHFVTISILAEIIQKSNETVRMWEYKRYLPKSTHTDSRKWRMYSLNQVALVVFGVHKVDIGEWSLAEMGEYLKSCWEEEDIDGRESEIESDS